MYITSEEIRNEIELSRQNGEATHRLMEIFYEISSGMSRKLRYKCEEDRQDMIQEAVMVMWKYWRNYDPEKNKNAFAYVSQMAKNGLAMGFRKQFPPKRRGYVQISIDGGDIYSL